MNKPIRIAIIGAGSIFSAHASALRKAAGLAEVVAVIKNHPEDTGEVHEWLGDVRIERDYRGVLDMVDAVDILLPHDLHLPICLEAARAGKHILVEKVMARNIAECDQMIEACEKQDVKKIFGYPVCLRQERGNTERVLLRTVCIERIGENMRPIKPAICRAVSHAWNETLHMLLEEFLDLIFLALIPGFGNELELPYSQTASHEPPPARKAFTQPVLIEFGG